MEIPLVDAAQHPPRTRRGAVIMAVSAALFAVMAALVKYAVQAGATAAEVTFSRFFFGFITILVLWATGVIKLNTKRPALVTARGVFGSIAIIFFFYSVSRTSLSKSSLLSYMWVIYAPILSAIVLREKPGPLIVGLLALSFAGIWLITDPGEFGKFGSGEIFGIISAVLSAIAILIIRELRRTDSHYTIFMSLSTVGSLAALVMMYVDPTPDVHHPILLLLAVGLSSTLGQLMMTYAYRWCSTAEGSILAMLSPALGVVLGSILFGDNITPTMVIGGVLVFGSGTYLTIKENG